MTTVYVGWATTESFTGIQDQITLYGMLQGAGAAAPVIPTTTVSSTSSKGFMQASTNKISTATGDIVRLAQGQYTLKLQSQNGLPPIVLDFAPNVWGPNGRWATPVDANPSTGLITFNVFAPGGLADDLAANDFVHFTFTCQNTTPLK